MLQTIKRLLLSLSIIGLFALYALQQQTSPGITPLATSSQQGIADANPSRTPTPRSVVPIVTAIAKLQNSDDEEGDDGDDDDGAPVVLASQKTPIPTQPAANAAAPQTSGLWRDGVYTGDSANASWGDVQVQVTIAGGSITDVTFTTYPNHRNRSVSINDQAMPILSQEAIAAQSAQVDIVSGATDTSIAFIQSLDSALQQAAA
ncbi:MAG: FMN-binding protein [Thermomicrobiales bacterium]